MATAVLSDSSLVIIYDAGIDEDGEPIFKRRTFNNVKTSATHDELFSIVQALTPLQQYSVNRVERNNSFDLSA
jgi:hypothetical protein